MDVQQKLSGFYRIIMGEAQQKKSKIFSELIQKIENDFKRDYEKETRLALTKINNKKFDFEQDANKKIVENASAERKKFLQLRSKLKDELFDRIQQSLIEFTNSQIYFEQIEKELRAINFQNPSIEFSNSDNELLLVMRQKFPFKMFLSEENFLGGYRIYLADSKIVIDKSFKLRLENAKSNFNKFKLPNF